MKTTMLKRTTTNIEKGKRWIWDAFKNGKNEYFRFVSYRYRKDEYTEWMIPEWAWKQAQGRNEYNTLRIEKLIY